MKYTFIIPVYKAEEYISKCVDNILTQTYTDLEVILVDDGSPDNSPVLCDKLSAQDRRIRTIHKKNGGASSARNEGLRYATGDYIIFLDSDDWWCDNTALDRINRKVFDRNPDIVIFQSKKYFQIGKRYSEVSEQQDNLYASDIDDIESLMKYGIFIASAWDKVIRKTVLIDNNIFFVEGQVGEDIEWCCRLLQQSLTYATIGGVVHVYRQENGSSVTANLSNKNLKDIFEIIEKYHKIAIDRQIVPLLHFLALEFVLWCAITNYATGEEGKLMIRQMGQHFKLLNFNWYPRVAIVAKVKFLGYNIVRKMLVWYLNRCS